jgi:hypothetical protein
MNSSTSEQQSIAAKSKKYSKCEYIEYSASVENNGMQAYSKKGLTQGLTVEKST